MMWQILRGSRSFLPSDVIDELAKSEDISVYGLIHATHICKKILILRH